LGGVGEGREQKKLEARKMLLEAADSQKSAARFVSLLANCKTLKPIKDFANMLQPLNRIHNFTLVCMIKTLI
jgi:hypothetical protein